MLQFERGAAIRLRGGHTEHIESFSQTRLLRFQKVARVAAIVIGVIGFGVYTRRLFWPHFSDFKLLNFKTNTALGLLTSGIALFFLADEKVDNQFAIYFGRLAAAITAFIGTATLVEYLGSVDLGIDQLLAPDYSVPADPYLIHYLGRMAPNTALCYSLLGLALLTLRFRERAKEIFFLRMILLVPLMIISVFAILGHVFAIAELYQMPGYARISWLTASCFLVLALGILFSRPESPIVRVLASQAPGGFMARRLLLTASVIPIGLGWLNLYGQKNNLFGLQAGMAWLVFSIVVLFALVIWQNAKSLNALDLERRILLRKEQKSLVEREKYFRTLVDTSPAMLWISDAHGACTYLSRQWYEYTGSMLREGAPWDEYIHPDDRDARTKSYLECERSRVDYRMDYRLRDRDGIYRWVNDRASPHYGHDGTFLGYIGMVIDVNERKLAEEGLKSAIAQRDEFLSIASHELKTPITALKLQIEMTQRRLRLQAENSPLAVSVEKAIKTSNRLIGRLTELVEDLLDVSRIQGGRLTFTFEEIDVEEAVRDLVERFSDQLAKADSVIKLNIKSGLRARWDSSRIEQVLVNLLTNALKYAPGAPIEIFITSDNKNATIVVQDWGPGIRPERQGKIFERFERAGASRNITGLGLGLFIVSQIVKGHHGSIRVESVVGEGSRFILNLPLDPTAAHIEMGPSATL